MKWSVGTKIAAAFAVVLVGLVAIGTTCFVSTRKLVETSRLVTRTHQVLEKLEGVISLLKDAETGQRGYVLTGEPRYLEPHANAARLLVQEISDLKSLTQDNPQQFARAKTLESLSAVKLGELQETIDLRKGKAGDEGFQAALKVILTDRGKQTMDEIRTAAREMQNDSRELLDKRSKDADDAAVTAEIAIAGGVPLCIGLVLVAGFLLSRNISTPLRHISAAARQIAAGDLAVQVKNDGRTDEVGVLARTFGEMTGALQVMASVAERIAEGDLRADVTPQSARDVLGTAFSKMIRNLRQITGDIVEGVNVLGSSATEIVATTSQLATSSAQTAAAVTETTTTVEEVRQTAQVSSQKARQVSETAQRVVSVSQDGKKSTENTSDGMARIRDQMDSIAQSMVRLGEQTQAIGQIISTVDDLAQQSNLLAVNASIEAAKAGEQGRGFSIVAQEVKSLAEQSKQATAQVRTILSDVQKATGVAVMATEQGTKAVDAGVQQSSVAGASIVSLADSVTDAASAAAQIAASSQQQLVGVDQVAQAMESIKKASTQNVDSARQLETAARSLGSLGQRLKESVGRYKFETAKAA